MTEDHPILAMKWKRISIIASPLDGTVVVVQKTCHTDLQMQSTNFLIWGGTWKWCIRHEWQNEMHSTVAFWTLRSTKQFPWHNSSYKLNSQTYKDVCRGWGWSVWIFIVTSTIKILRTYLLHFKYSNFLGEAEISPYALRTENIWCFMDPCIIVKFIQKNPTRCNSVSKFIIPYLYEAQHVSSDTPPIIRSLKLL
jgi:hypothetical protein